jgi:hypothetical protein
VLFNHLAELIAPVVRVRAADRAADRGRVIVAFQATLIARAICRS